MTSQLLGVPVRTLVVQGSLSSHTQLLGGSQVSPRLASMRPLPQPGQSESVVASQPEGQQPSPPLHAVIGVWLQLTSQLAALPLMASAVQASASSQLVGQLADGSQVSPRLASTWPLPQPGQSESVVGPHPPGQQPSPPLHSVIAVCAQLTLQVSAPPSVMSMVQASPSSQAMLAQVEGGSQVSFDSIAPLPQLGEQSESTFALQPSGQQPSPFAQALIGS